MSSREWKESLPERSQVTKERREAARSPGDQRARGLALKRGSVKRRGAGTEKGSGQAGTVEFDGMGRAKAADPISWPPPAA